MTGQTAVPPPLPSAATKPKAKWWKFAIAILAGGFLLLRFLASISDSVTVTAPAIGTLTAKSATADVTTTGKLGTMTVAGDYSGEVTAGSGLRQCTVSPPPRPASETTSCACASTGSSESSVPRSASLSGPK